MSDQFFARPILNSPYEYPARHWELDSSGQPTQKIVFSRRRADFITPIPKPRKKRGEHEQAGLLFDEGKGLSTVKQTYDHTAIINAVRQEVDAWRKLPPSQWRVTPETARLLEHWRNHKFAGVRPFFCQVEAAETAIWLTEVAPQLGKNGKRFLDHLDKASNDANPGLLRLALKLATGAGKTTVMAMLIAWQTVNAVRHPQSKKFTRGFLLVAPGLTIKDRLRVLLPNDADSYYASREPAAVLRRSPRQGLSMGRATQARSAPDHRRSAACRDPRACRGDPRSAVCRGQQAGDATEAETVRKIWRRSTASLWRTAGVAGRCEGCRRGFTAGAG